MKTIRVSDGIDILFAIKDSINYDKIVTVTLADGVTVETALVWVCQRSERYQSTRIDSNDAGARREDVWGDDGQGGEFRLLLVEGQA